MVYISDLIWDDWNEAHIARHHVTREEVEEVCFSTQNLGVRMRRGRYRLIGQTAAGRYLTVILDLSGKGQFYVITSRDTTHSERRRLQRWRGR